MHWLSEVSHGCVCSVEMCCDRIDVIEFVSFFRIHECISKSNDPMKSFLMDMDSRLVSSLQNDRYFFFLR